MEFAYGAFAAMFACFMIWMTVGERDAKVSAPGRISAGTVVTLVLCLFFWALMRVAGINVLRGMVIALLLGVYAVSAVTAARTDR
ncbi:MAG: hypothetical protein OXN97_04670 [Bryobacterales bacterium]|nr:hypothetical protein [Bryobacterales bacterium]